MSEDSTRQLSRALLWVCWLPLVSLLGIELYIRNFDGWGAWASAALLLVPAIVGLPIVILGLSECVARSRARAPLLPAVRPAGVLIGFESEDDWLEYRLENHPEFLARVTAARTALRTGKGTPLEEAV